MMQKFIVAFFKVRAAAAALRKRRPARRIRAACMVCKKKFMAAYPGDNICGACRADIDARAQALQQGASEPS
jgi:hypothetical protein